MSAILLPRPPEVPAGNVDEIVAAANALERAAARRYRKLAHAMWRVGHEDVAQVFDELANEEEQHVQSVEKLADALLGKMPADDIVRWVLPETFGTEEAGSTALLTPYKALSIAVHAEERAFAFWSYVAANAGAEPVRALAEKMAHQELLHAAKFRIERRKAYRAEVRLRRPRPKAQPLGQDELRSETLGMGAETAAFLSETAARLDKLEDTESARLVRAIASEITSAEEPGDQQALPRKAAERSEQDSAAAVLFDLEGVLERRAERYIALFDRSRDADMTAELQRLADEAMRLASRISARLATIDPQLRALVVGRSEADPTSD